MTKQVRRRRGLFFCCYCIWGHIHLGLVGHIFYFSGVATDLDPQSGSARAAGTVELLKNLKAAPWTSEPNTRCVCYLVCLKFSIRVWYRIMSLGCAYLIFIHPVSIARSSQFQRQSSTTCGNPHSHPQLLHPSSTGFPTKNQLN